MMPAVEAAPFGLIPGDSSDSDDVCSNAGYAADNVLTGDKISHSRSSVHNNKRGEADPSETEQRRNLESRRVNSAKRSSRYSVTCGRHSLPGSGQTTPTPGSNSEVRLSPLKDTTPPTRDRESTPENCTEGSSNSSNGVCGDETAEPEIAETNTILIFDWDDTLFPSTWLSLQELTLDENCRVPPNKVVILKEMAECSKRLLKVATSLGTVVIVTNAEEGWIDLSCKKFLPSLYDYLSQFKQLSARTKYEKQISNCPFTWKQMAFRDEIYAHFQNIATPPQTGRDHNFCVVSLGDSAHERLAVISITKLLPFNKKKSTPAKTPLIGSGLDNHNNNADGIIGQSKDPSNNGEGWGTCRTKSIKFIERPGIDELMQEHGLIMNLLEGVVKHNDDMDLYIRSSNPLGIPSSNAAAATSFGSSLQPSPTTGTTTTTAASAWTKQQQTAASFNDTMARNRNRATTATASTASMVRRIKT